VDYKSKARDFVKLYSFLIEDLNTRFNTSFTEDEIMVIKQLEKKISEDEALQQQLKNGAKHAVEATFRQVAEDTFQDLVNDNFKFYKKVSEDDEVSKEFFARLFEWHIEGARRPRRRSRADGGGKRKSTRATLTARRTAPSGSGTSATRLSASSWRTGLRTSEPRITDQLWRAIKGKGAFRHFKDTAHRLGLIDDWYRIRDVAIRQHMLGWAEINGVSVDDSASSPERG